MLVFSNMVDYIYEEVIKFSSLKVNKHDYKGIGKYWTVLYKWKNKWFWQG